MIRDEGFLFVVEVGSGTVHGLHYRSDVSCGPAFKLISANFSSRINCHGVSSQLRCAHLDATQISAAACAQEIKNALPLLVHAVAGYYVAF